MFRQRVLACILAIVLVVSGVLLSPAAPVSAYTTSDLYGIGSADEANILKLLDMALNKAGMSMSLDTIKSFYEFWWDSVSDDLQTLIADVDSSVSTAADFVEYGVTACDAGDIAKTTLKFMRYCLAQGAVSLSDFYELLLQPGLFRAFLLSYVADEDGTLIGTGDYTFKASSKYCIGSDFVNMVRDAADAYIEEYEGYYLLKTHTVDEISPTIFDTKDVYDAVVGLLRGIGDDQLVFVSKYWYKDQYYYFTDISDCYFVYNACNVSDLFYMFTYDDNWTNYYGPNAYFIYRLSSGVIDGLDFGIDNIGAGSLSISLNSFYSVLGNDPFANSGKNYGWVFSADGRSIKVYKTFDAFKAHTVGRDNIYYGANYATYDSSVDNSVTFTGSYYNNNSTSYSHQTIQQQIDNSSEVNESTVNNIVNNYITNNYGDGSGDGSGGDGSGGWWDIGDGISSFIEGIAGLLDFVLKLLGDLIGVIAGFLSDLLTVLESLAVIGSNFGSFVSDFFSFLPEECIAMIVSGIGFLVIVGVIKMFRG